MKINLLAAGLAAAFAFTAGPASAEMKTQWVEYNQGDTKLKAYMAYDDKITGKRPAIFMVHDREGMTEHSQHLAETWSKLGYVSFAADIFGVVPKNLDEVVAQTSLFRKDRALLKARTQAGFDALVKNPMVDAVEGGAGRLLLRRRGRRGIRLDRRAARGQRLDPRLVRRPRSGLGEEHQGHVPDPARRRG